MEAIPNVVLDGDEVAPKDPKAFGASFSGFEAPKKEFGLETAAGWLPKVDVAVDDPKENPEVADGKAAGAVLIGSMAGGASAGFAPKPKLNPPFLLRAGAGACVTGAAGVSAPNLKPPKSGFFTSSFSGCLAAIGSAALISVPKVILFSTNGADFCAPNENIGAAGLASSFFSSSFFSAGLKAKDAVTDGVGAGDLNVKEGTATSVVASEGLAFSAALELFIPNEKVGCGLSTSSGTFAGSSTFLVSTGASTLAACIPNENFTSDGAGSDTDEVILLPNEN